MWFLKPTTRNKVEVVLLVINFCCFCWCCFFCRQARTEPLFTAPPSHVNASCQKLRRILSKGHLDSLPSSLALLEGVGMTLYSIYIFNRYGDNIFYMQWNRTSAVQEGEASLVAGFIYTLQHLSSQLSSTGTSGLRAVQTPFYKLHYAETMTGYRVALLTCRNVSTALVQGIFIEMFRDVFHKTLTRDLNYRHKPGCMITNPDFAEGLEALFRSKQLLE
ncbi:hypothetical protein TCDM_14455 [Trypanosoma cruzi Dm28c]|uniref:Trafficking protein particle complex subunit n=2 Tax=Trypanosoma cruzi TaxID=5693 RepID=V5BD58_TRYCR|nr:hypothetical protein TCDM_14455 [Trypanosoma cruzi Dm28c]